MNTNTLGGNGFAKGGDGGSREYESNVPSIIVRGGDGGNNGSPGQAGTPYGSMLSYSATSAGGSGGGGYVIPFSALEVETIGELVPGAGVVVVAW